MPRPQHSPCPADAPAWLRRPHAPRSQSLQVRSEPGPCTRALKAEIIYYAIADHLPFITTIYIYIYVTQAIRNLWGRLVEEGSKPPAPWSLPRPETAPHRAPWHPWLPNSGVRTVEGKSSACDEQRILVSLPNTPPTLPSIRHDIQTVDEGLRRYRKGCSTASPAVNSRSHPLPDTQRVIIECPPRSQTRNPTTPYLTFFGTWCISGRGKHLHGD